MPLLSVDFHASMYASVVKKGLELDRKNLACPVLPSLMDAPNESDPGTPSLYYQALNEAAIRRKERKENAKKRKREALETGTRPPPEDYHCVYWITKKLRYCNMHRHKGTIPRQEA